MNKVAPEQEALQIVAGTSCGSIQHILHLITPTIQ